MRSDVSDFDFPGFRVDTKVNPAAAAKTSVPLEQLPRAAVGWESARLAEGRIVHPVVALGRHLRSPFRHGSAAIEPIPGGPVERVQLADDG